ncbi:hypothetical protein Sta7437_3854 [Stanieria cyanosphaera PCC 7437]|uniref:Uncharacterized protein n=1 Tax=Stanieria cyanosphaera (strain ATCC 29371 / PCC 7437) TaxID=111780 RepID=K9XXT6_STAC7|nr:hypothetical protein Sta7437_3854 [Stanieria cyanosphaera PCC 7437]
MTVELSQALSIILVISLACIILSPILWWILPNRRQSI